MRKLAIYKENNGSGIASVHFMPDEKTDEEIEKAINDYNSSQDYRTVSCIEIPEELNDVIAFLIEDRRIEINRHLEAIRDLQRDLNIMSSDLDNVMYDLKTTIKKQDKE